MIDFENSRIARFVAILDNYLALDSFVPVHLVLFTSEKRRLSKWYPQLNFVEKYPVSNHQVVCFVYKK